MPTPNVTLEELYRGITRPAGKMHKLVIKRIPARFLELDVGFAFRSGVLLPVLPGEVGGTTPKEPKAPPFAVLKQVFDYAAQNPGKKLLIAGHTDTSGSVSVNRVFSEIRANSVYALLRGDRELWAESAERRHEITDIQTILRWAAREHGFGCDPGEIDGVPGPKTRSAQERFRRRYNDEFAGHLRVVGPMTLQDWKAFFDLYEVSLARVLGVAEGKLASKRASLSFLAEPVLGCGEHWPVAGVGVDGLKSATNRRVDFVFFDEDGFPSLQKQDPPGYELYGMSLRFKREVIALRADTEPGLYRLEVQLLDAWHRPCTERKYKLEAATFSAQGVTDHDGFIRHDLPDTLFEVLLTTWTAGDPNGAGSARLLALGELDGLGGSDEARARLEALGYIDPTGTPSAFDIAAALATRDRVLKPDQPDERKPVTEPSESLMAALRRDQAQPGAVT